MSRFNLTFNKPAATMFFADGIAGVKVKIDGKGKAMFKPSVKEGRDVFPLSARTRGGVGITLEGKFAEAFLQGTDMDRGTHMALEQSGYKWIAGSAVEGKPSKVVPTARLWRAKDEIGAKAEVAPVRKTRKARAVKAAAPVARKPRAAKRAANAEAVAA